MLSFCSHQRPVHRLLNQVRRRREGRREGGRGRRRGRGRGREGI